MNERAEHDVLSEQARTSQHTTKVNAESIVAKSQGGGPSGYEGAGAEELRQVKQAGNFLDLSHQKFSANIAIV